MMKFYKKEIKELIIADFILALAFTEIIYSPKEFSNFFYTFLISLAAVTIGFAFHEIAHKLTAQHFGAIAFFQASFFGLLFSLLTSFFGFLIAIPGATIIASRLTKKEYGIVSLAGPAWNIFMGLLCIFLSLLFPNIADVFTFIGFVNIILGFFNMLPIYPLDGSKVLAWNKGVYIISIAIIALLIFYFGILSIAQILFMLILALVFSYFFRLV
ncbi:MAG: site-2 protease family protein [Candidatus Micrarchaeia archaeon]